MSRLRSGIILTLALLVLVVALLIVGGLRVRAILTQSFADAEQTRAARLLTAGAVRAQLDEETGVRGYSSVRDPLLLEPYFRGRRLLPVFLARIQEAAQRLKLVETQSVLADAARTNRRWVREIARPLLGTKKHSHVLELHGKILVDRFRIDIASVDRLLARRETVVDTGAERALGWANIFAIAAILVVVLAAAFFTVQQYRLGQRLERQRALAEQQRQQSVAMRAAYVAEKRIADTLQEAFAQRVLPALPSVRLSATYVPATEEAKVGGDWYDALQVAENRVLLAIGDVAGHGINAAVAMSRARQIVISCALVDPTPGKVLERVNTELFAENAPMITAIVGLVDARSCEFSYAAAGHPAPVLLEPGARARFLEVGSLPLGINADAAYLTHRVRSVPGAILVLYTDGAIEHSRDVVQGEALLLEAVESAAKLGVDDTAAAIRADIFKDHRVADDVAILTINFVETAAAGRSGGRLRRTA